jgi:hypothetical protein
VPWIAVDGFICLPALHYGFLWYPLYATKNEEGSQGLTWDGFVRAWTTGHAADWHPLTWLSHRLDVQLYGQAAGFHHLTNVLLHIANSLCRCSGHEAG